MEVARIPEQHIQEFGDRLRGEGFIPALPGERFERLLSTVETAEVNFHSWTILSKFGDGAIAFVEDPCSDWEEAVNGWRSLHFTLHTQTTPGEQFGSPGVIHMAIAPGRSWPAPAFAGPSFRSGTHSCGRCRSDGRFPAVCMVRGRPNHNAG